MIDEASQVAALGCVYDVLIVITHITGMIDEAS